MARRYDKPYYYRKCNCRAIYSCKAGMEILISAHTTGTNHTCSMAGRSRSSILTKPPALVPKSPAIGCATLVSDGFDALTTPGPSMKTYNPSTDNYTGIPSTLVPFSPALGGYMTFIRGRQFNHLVRSCKHQPVLRTKGPYLPGPPAPVTVVAGTFESTR